MKKNRFAEVLRELRLEKGLTQQQLGDIIGYRRVSICDWESRGRYPNYDVLIQLAEYFGVTVGYLLGVEE